MPGFNDTLIFQASYLAVPINSFRFILSYSGLPSVSLSFCLYGYSRAICLGTIVKKDFFSFPIGNTNLPK